MGIVEKSAVPEWNPEDQNLKAFNWGVFGCGIVWGLSHGVLKKIVWLDLLSWLILFPCCFIPIWGIVFIPLLLGIRIYFGTKGNEWAYSGRAWNDVQDFFDTQKRWMIFALVTWILFIFYLVTIVIFTLFFGTSPLPGSGNNDYNFFKLEFKQFDNEAVDDLKLFNVMMIADSIVTQEKVNGKFKNSNEIVDYMLKSAPANSKIKRLSSKSIAQYSDDNIDETIIDQVYIFTKEENCTLEERNCRIYLYYDVKPGDTPPPQIAVYYDSNGKVKKLNTKKSIKK